MTTTLKSVRVSDARISNSLLEGMLQAIGVEPIPQNLADDYMARELANAPTSTALGRFLHRHGCSEVPFDDFLKACLAFLCVVGICAFAAGIIWSWWWVAGVGAVLAIITAGLFGEMQYGSILVNLARGPAYWRTTSTDYMYLWRLPLFARERIELVQRYFPEMRFEVADLRQNYYSLDPVLFALLGDERRAICVWSGQEEICFS